MRPSSFPIKIQSWAFLALLIWLTAACAQPIQTRAYYELAQSSNNLLEGSNETYNKIGDYQRHFMVVQVEKGDITENSFKPLDLVPELEFRKSALKVMVRYTEVLNSLAETDYGSDVDRASERLSDSLSSLGSGDKTKNASGILATIAKTVGNMIVEKKRRGALNEVMDQAQPALDDLAALLEGSNTSLKGIVKDMFDANLEVENDLRSPTQDYHRLMLDTHISKEIAEVEGIQSSLDSLIHGIGLIPRAHLEIRQSLDQSIGAMEALKKLIKEGQQANKFYQSVK